MFKYSAIDEHKKKFRFIQLLTIRIFVVSLLIVRKMTITNEDMDSGKFDSEHLQ